MIVGVLAVGPGCRANVHECERIPPCAHDHGGDRDCACDPAPLVAAPADPPPDQAFLTAYVATEGFTLGVPEPVAIAPDGTVVFRRTGPRSPRGELFQLDVDGNTKRIATADACPWYFYADRGVLPDDASEDGGRILVSGTGATCVVDRATAHTGQVAHEANEARLSPDGKRLAFMDDDKLQVVPVDGPFFSRPLAELHRDRGFGAAVSVARDLGNLHELWWSPDGKAIAFQRVDARAVGDIAVPYPAPSRRAPFMAAHAQPGGALPLVELGVVSARGGAPIWVRWDHAQFPYLVRVLWSAHAPLTLLVMSRDQRMLAMLRVDVATGQTHALVTERDPAWVELGPNRVTWLDDGSGFLWMSEAQGAWTLSQYRADGSWLRDVVGADFGLRDVAGVTPAGEVIVMAATEPREQHVWRVPLAGGAPVALTSGGGVHSAMTRRGVVVVTSQLRDGGTKVMVIRGEAPGRELPGSAERPALVPTTQIEDLATGDHRQYVAITRPRTFDRRRRYPVLINVAGDLAHQAVVDARDTYLFDQWLADAGFIVVRTDGRGTPGRGRAFSRAIAGDVIALPLADQLAGLDAAIALHPELDRAHVGVFGSRYGGYVAVMAVLRHPEVFAAASANTPIVDWERYSAVYGERYMKLPADNAEAYRRTSALGQADRLARPLLVLDGSTLGLLENDDIRAFVDATRGARKLVERVDRPVDHSIRSGRAARTPDTTLERALVEFFRRHVAPRPGAR